MFKNLKVGEVLSETQFYTVEKIVKDKVQLRPDQGDTIVVTSDYVDSFLNSADQFTKTEKVTRTELVEKFLSSTRVAMTVNFNKQVKPADVKAAIVSLYPNKGGRLISEADFKKAVSKAVDLKGEERTMTGRHYGVQDANGRVQFVDMKLPVNDPSNRMRLVDPRTLNWLIVGGTKYEVK